MRKAVKICSKEADERIHLGVTKKHQPVDAVPALVFVMFSQGTLAMSETIFVENASLIGAYVKERKQYVESTYSFTGAAGNRSRHSETARDARDAVPGELWVFPNAHGERETGLGDVPATLPCETRDERGNSVSENPGRTAATLGIFCGA